MLLSGWCICATSFWLSLFQEEFYDDFDSESEESFAHKDAQDEVQKLFNSCIGAPSFLDRCSANSVSKAPRNEHMVKIDAVQFMQQLSRQVFPSPMVTMVLCLRR